MEDKRSAYFLVVAFALSLGSVSGGCEKHALGLADGYILDNQMIASSILNAHTPANNGRLNYTAGSSWCASTNDSSPYLQIDLQTPHIICAVSTQGNSQGDQWVKTYTLQSSTDARTWTDYEESGQVKVFLGNFDANSTAKGVLFSELSTRHLRVVARSNHSGACMRIELYGVRQIQGNIALFKPTSQSSTYETSISSNAVDGERNTNDYKRCTHTKGTTNPWWRVDLGREQPVSSVRILNRGDCCPERLNGAEIRVGNNASSGGAFNYLCASNIRIPPGIQKDFLCKPAAHGRYVYIRIPGSSRILTLCEVEVYSPSFTNLALNQTAEQIDVDPDYPGVASRAVDGNPSTDFFQDNSCTHTSSRNDPWWRVDLGSSVSVAEVVIVNRACGGDCGSRLNAFEIRIGDVNESNGGTSNPSCGNIHSVNSGETKSFYCLPRLVGRYIYIRVPGDNKVLTLCEVEVYSIRRISKACNDQPVGLEDSSKVPDYRFTASSNGVSKSPLFGRLRGSNAWLPRTTNNADDFLQIDLGSVYVVCSVATQGSSNEWTKTYKIKTSLDNSNWTTYAEKNVDKVFNGNNDDKSIIRNDLLYPTYAKFIRIYPVSFNGSKTLRVEVYGSSEGCRSPLGLEDSQISASSEVDANHTANFSRLYSSSSWCSATDSSSEYLQVDLGQTMAVTGIATQGDPSSDKWVTRYMVQFGTDSYTRWVRKLSFQGNQGRDLTYVNWFSVPVETRVVRIFPLSWKTSVCLRFELYGCGLLLKVPKPTVNNVPEVNLQPGKGSFVDLTCNASSKANGMAVAFRWGNEGKDMTSFSSGVATQGKFFLSTLRVNFTKAKDIMSSYNCTRESEGLRMVNCDKTFVCFVLYSSLSLRQEPAYQATVVTVKLQPATISVSGPPILKLHRGDKNVTVHCFGRGKPRPTITWKKNGKEVLKSSSDTVNKVIQAIFNSSDPWNVSSVLYLRLAGVTYDEAGNYTCEVYNGVDENKTMESIIRVSFKPEFLEVPRNQTIVLQGRDVTLPCNVTGIPKPAISWRFDGGILPPSRQEEDGSLRLFAVGNNQTYEGLYTCVASNVAGTLTTNVTLIVDVVPFFLSPLENVTLLRGSRLNLTCPADGDPLPRIYWTKNGSPIIPHANFSQQNSAMVIASVEIPDEGLYECTARSRAGNDSSKAHVKVQVQSNVFVSGNKTLILKRDQKNVSIKCFGNGYPAPTVRWRKRSNVIPVVSEPTNDAAVQVLFTDIQRPMDNVTSDLYLRIGGVTYNESGNYTCTADNGAGEHTAAASVEVIFKPEFVIKPQSETAKEGETVSFVCEASGVPQPDVSWGFNNNSLPPHSIDFNGNLTIPSVVNNKTYEGTYTCTARSRAGVATIDVVLAVHVPPRLILTPNKSVIAERGDTVRLSCSAVGDPTPRYQWTKDGSPVIPNATLGNSNKTLQLSNVDSSNDGIYTCLAVNDAGNISTSSNVTVHARPSLLNSLPKLSTKIEDRLLQLSCTGESIPVPDVTWYKDNETVTSSQHILINTSGEFKRVTTLIIETVKYEDRGEYTCSFTNYRGNVSSTGRLIVNVPPNILIPPTSVKEKLGFQVTFNCTLRGFPLPELVWTKDNIDLHDSNGVQIVKQRDSGKIESFTSLTIVHAKRNDTGAFVCHANNSAGTTAKEANLTVLEKPDKLGAKIDSTTARTVKISWAVSFHGNSPVLFYTVAHNISNGTRSYNVSSNESSLVINLIPATFYEFTITATNQFGTSDPVVVSATTLEAVPSAPRFVRATVTTSRSIFVKWTVPAVTNGKLVKYVVYYGKTEEYGDNTTVPMNHTLLPNTTSVVIDSLVPSTTYIIQVQAFTKVGGGNRSDHTGPVGTFEDVPGAPYGIRVTKQDEKAFVIQWKSPAEPNGIITGYKLYLLVKRSNVEGTEDVKDKVYVIEDKSTTKSVNLYELNGDKTYDVIVQARTSIGYGKNSTKDQTLKTPPIPPPSPLPPQPPNETTTSTAVIELAEFSDINGPITYYQVINVRVPQGSQDSVPTPDDITPKDLVSYEEAHNSKKPAAYIAFAFRGGDFNKHKRFTLGKGQTCCNRKRRDIAKTYYNGPLQPNTNYQAFTRAFTSESEYSQSQYIQIKTEEEPKKPPPPSSGSPTAIIAGVVVGLLLVIIAAAVFIYLRRHAPTRKRRARDDATDENELDPLEGCVNEGVYCDIDGNRRPIPVQDLKELYKRMREDNNRFFDEEYKSIKITGTPTTQICDRPGNKVRNRYGNIKAYDHSRVVLTMEGSSDYINANYIDGYVRPKQYIATIGPKPETVDHFWWMIWQENTSIIVMLTKPVEQGKIKCQQYWPDSGSEEYGTLTVTLKDKLEYSEFEIRTLSLQVPTRPDLKPRTVTHFYFTAWPDHDVPDEATGLLQFWKAVKKSTSGNDAPMVVHCSAGVGRTGTFITIDAMMEQISASEELDVYNFVTRMREQRNFMVQRQSQYNFIFYALLEATTFGDTEIQSHDLRIKMQKMAAKNPSTGKTAFEREFELLDGVVRQENPDFTSALKSANTKKNRYTNVLPYEKSRVVMLKTSEDEDDDTSYINASYIEGYQQKKTYIATQAPLRNTVGDFWRMVWDEEVCCIVMLIPLKEDSEQPFVDYWSEVEATMHGSLSIETTDFDNKETYSVRKINLSETETEKVRKVTQYTFTNWPKDGIPADPMAVINLIGAMQKTQQQTGNHPIVVHCSDGIGRSGTFCALVTSLERIKLEDSVDVFTTVRMLRTQRPGMVQTLEQYKFIYDALIAYLDSFEASLYQNFL